MCGREEVPIITPVNSNILSLKFDNLLIWVGHKREITREFSNLDVNDIPLTKNESS